MRWKRLIPLLYETLTEYDCYTRDDIAQQMGVAKVTVDFVLAYVRQPEIADMLGWTVPFVARGQNQIYRVVQRNSTEDLTPYIDLEFRPSARQTCSAVSSMGEKQGYALREIARHCDPTSARLMRRAATALEGAAAMTRDMAERLV